MQSLIKILLVEDQVTDAELEARELKRAGLDCDVVRVDREEEFMRSLHAFSPDVILCDFSMPHFDGFSALEITRKHRPDTPFIFVSGTIGEEFAIESLKRGAVDYVLKTNLMRLGPAVSRALQGMEEQRARLAAERELNESRLRFELFMRYLPGAASIKDRQGRYRFVNRSWEEMTGRKSADVLDRTDRELWPDLASQYEAHDRTVFETNNASRSTVTFPQGDHLHHYLVQKFPIQDREGGAILLGSIAVDFTERLSAEEKIARLSRIHAVLSGINSAIVRIRDKDELLWEACRIAVEHGRFRLAWIGWLDQDTLEVRPAASAGGQAGYLAQIRVSARDDLPEGKGIIGNAMRDGKPVIVNDVAVDPRMRYARDAIAHGLRAAVALPLQVEGRSVGAMMLYAGETGVFDHEEMTLLAELAGDISFALDHIEKEERLHYLAYYDALTGLPNTALFCERVNQMLHTAERQRRAVAVAVFDLDRFRQVNDSLGRSAGDALLRQVADCMRAVGETDNVARIGSNQFAAAFTEIDDPAQLAHLLEEKFCGSMGRIFEIDGRELRVSSTAGVSFFPADGADTQALLGNAEAALKKAKTSGHRYLFYAPAMNAQVADRVSLESRLRRAIDRNEFVLHYQPKVDAGTGALAGVEALLRWNDPERGLVQPGEFMPLLEETGLILLVGVWVLKQASADYRDWRARGLDVRRIAVNVSPLQLRDSRFVTNVLDAIACQDGDDRPFELEITESLLMENIEDNVHRLKELREHGIATVIDDFGTGHSSLSYLAKLPATTVKIDRMFVETMDDNADNMSIISTIISLAHTLKLKVVAEGVETDEQARLLRLLKCDELQGYYFSRPLPSHDIERMYR